MALFLSYSGERSERVAILFSDWIAKVIQTSEPWLSVKKIGKDKPWFDQISEALHQAYFGIIFVTKTNQFAPWILYEAGALSHFPSGRTCSPFLIDMIPAEIDPKSPFHPLSHTKNDTSDIWNLVASINKTNPKGQIDEKILENSIAMHIRELRENITLIVSETGSHENAIFEETAKAGNILASKIIWDVPLDLDLGTF